MSGRLYLCATPIGNLGDISHRCLEILRSVDLIAAEDTRHTRKLLNHFEIDTPMTSYFEHNRKEKGEMLIRKLQDGESIALVSDAGTPAISDPGEDLVKLCIEHGVPVSPVPGPVAGICALISSGMATGRFAFEGFLPVNKNGRTERLEMVKDDTRTLIFYEAPHKLIATLSDMLEIFGNRKITICRELTKIHEEFLYFTLSEAVSYYQDTQPKGEFVLVLEGINEEKLMEQKQSEFLHLSPKEHLEMRMKEGLSEKDALKIVAQERGVPKREIYQELKVHGKQK